MNKTTIWTIVIAVVILAIIVYLYNRSTSNSLNTSGNIGGGKNPNVNTSTPSCNPLAERMIERDCNWQNPIHDGCTYVKKDIKPGTNNTICYWFKQ